MPPVPGRPAKGEEGKGGKRTNLNQERVAHVCHPSLGDPRWRGRGKVPKRKFLSEMSQAKVSKRKRLPPGDSLDAWGKGSSKSAKEVVFNCLAISPPQANKPYPPSNFSSLLDNFHIRQVQHNNNIIQELPSVTPRWCKCDMGCFHRALHGLDCCEYCRGGCDCGCSGCLRSDDEDTFFITFLEEENLLFWKTESRKNHQNSFFYKKKFFFFS